MEVIKKFVNEVEREYSSVKIGYKFDADESEYEKMKSKKPKLNMSRLINKVKGKVPKDHKRSVFQLSKKI